MPPPDRPRSRPIALRMALGVAGLALALGAAEAVLAALDLPRFHEPHSVPMQFAFPREDEAGVLLYTNAPSARIPFVYDGDPRGYFGAGGTVEHPTNAAGFRGPEFQTEKPPGTLRIAFLGDSFTFGEGVRFKDTYAERTAALLAERCDSPVESLNFAVGGYNTTLERQLFERRVLGYAPDVVVLGFVLNDAEPALYRRHPSGGIARLDRDADRIEGREPRPPEGGVYRLRSAQLVWKALSRRKRTDDTVAYYRDLYEEYEEGWQASRRALAEIGELCRARGIPLVVLVFPILVELDGAYPFEDVHARVRRAVEQIGATCVDLLETFRGLDAQALWVHPTDQHPNDEAHGLAARRLSDELIASGAVHCGD